MPELYCSIRGILYPILKAHTDSITHLGKEMHNENVVVLTLAAS